MLARLFQQLLNSCGVVFRTFRAFFTRQFMGLRARIRRITSFSRQAARLVPKAMSSLAVAGQKPTKREDFVETRRLFVSKSFLVMLAVGLVALVLLGYFVAWPWLVRKFFTAHYFQEASALKTYTGKVVVYYDQQKQSPRLRGRMQEGLLQGDGKEYDEAGRLRYAGGFVDSQYGGEGSLYEEGVLCYKGTFDKGVREGQGVSYYPSGNQKYRGNFIQGQCEGEGALYYENGQLRYKGQFLAGSFDGQGRLYREDGTLLYEGAFQKGIYAGEGKLRIDEDLQLLGQFENGEPLGEVSLYRAGKLWYLGEVRDLQPHGLGALYASDGTAIYSGPMRQGAPDFAALLGLSGDAIRAAFAKAPLVETAEESGFSIQNAALGVTLFCSYKTEESDPEVYRVYCYNDTADPFAKLMPWQSAQAFEAQAQGFEKLEDQERSAPLGTTPLTQGPYRCDIYRGEGYTVRGWSLPEDARWRMVEWRADRELPAAEPEEEDPVREPDRLSGLLQDLVAADPQPAEPPVVADPQPAEIPEQVPPPKKMILPSYIRQAAEAADSQAAEVAGPQAAEAAEQIPPPEEMPLPSDASQAGDLESVLSPIVEYYLQSETLKELEWQIAYTEEQLADEKGKALMGAGSETPLREMEDQAAGLEIQAGRVQVAMERLKLEAPGVETRDCDRILRTLLRPPAEFGAGALQAAGGSRAAELALLDLELAWQTVQQAKAALENAVTAAEEAQISYKTGAVEKTALFQARHAESEAAVRLYEAIYSYATQALAFNTTTGGYLASQYGWPAALES